MNAIVVTSGEMFVILAAHFLEKFGRLFNKEISIRTEGLE